jgi:hypothetical protein
MSTVLFSLGRMRVKRIAGLHDLGRGVYSCVWAFLWVKSRVVGSIYGGGGCLITALR